MAMKAYICYHQLGVGNSASGDKRSVKQSHCLTAKFFTEDECCCNNV